MCVLGLSIGLVSCNLECEEIFWRDFGLRVVLIRMVDTSWVFWFDSEFSFRYDEFFSFFLIWENFSVILKKSWWWIEFNLDRLIFNCFGQFGAVNQLKKESKVSEFGIGLDFEAKIRWTGTRRRRSWRTGWSCWAWTISTWRARYSPPRSSRRRSTRRSRPPHWTPRRGWTCCWSGWRKRELQNANIKCLV